MTRVYSSQWDDKKEFDKWQKRISYMDRYFKNAQAKHGWKKFAAFLWGRASSVLQLNYEIINVNEIYAYIKTSIANLYSRNPYITVNPKKKEEILGAIIKEELLNYRWKSMDMKKCVKRCIAEAKLIGHSWVKLGYSAQTQQFESDKADEVDEFIVAEDIWAVRVPFENIRFDPDADNPPYDCRWIYHQYLKPISVLEAKYKIQGIKPNGSYKKEMKDKDKDLPDPEEDNPKTMVYEISDKDSGRKLVCCDGWGEWLENIPPVDEDCIGPYKIKGFPYVMLKFSDFPNRYDSQDNFPMADIEAWEDQYVEKVKFRSAQINHIKRFNRQILSKVGNIDQTEKEKLTQGQDGAIIEVQDITQTAPMAYAPVQADFYPVENKIDNDRDRICGQSQMDQGGEASTQTRTLGEIQQIQGATGGRKIEQTDVVEDFCKEIAYKFLQLEKQFADVEMIVRVTGNIPDPYLAELYKKGIYDGVSLKYTKEDIQSEEDVGIEFGTTMPLNKEMRIAACIQMAKVGQAFGLTPGSFASLELGKSIIKDLGLTAVELAFEKDIDILLQNKNKPNMDEQLKQAQAVQNIKKGQADIELKTQRTAATNLRNVKQALDNNDSLTGAKDNKEGEKPNVM